VLPITPFPNGVPEDSHSPTKERVKALLLAGHSVTEVARHLGVSKPTVCFHKKSLGIESDSRFSRRYDWAEIRGHYEQGHSMRECQAAYGFSGAAWSDAVARGDIQPRPRAEDQRDVFAYGAKRNRFHLKWRLLKDGLRTAVCEECGLVEWRGRPLSLELHHVNGDGRDNRLENLQLLCPNCHSQTDNWGGKAKTQRAA
jgi:DNA-binding CsgD family transcriptional regulator/5-methylcytosine-specific restriction endonuclease McrA